MALQQVEGVPRAQDLQEAIAFGGSDDAERLVLAGGTFLHGLEARGLLSDVEELIDIRRAGLDGIYDDDRSLLIGATVTFSQLQSLASVQGASWLAGLRDALDYPPVQIRNTATIGGCVSASCPFFDVPTALLALGAVVTAKGGEAGERQLALSAFLAGLFVNSLEPGELVTAVTIPKSAGNGASAFIKLEGNANDLAIVNAAVYLSIDSEKTCIEARVALGGGVAETAVLSVRLANRWLAASLMRRLYRRRATPCQLISARCPTIARRRSTAALWPRSSFENIERAIARWHEIST
jgi:CO/xanthine dehydrogenase FAD-binding subunit